MAEQEEKKEEQKEEKKVETAPKPDFDKMTALDLREYALKNHPGIAGVSAMKKEELLKALYEARGEVPPDKKKTAAGQAAAVKKELKKKIRLLIGEKKKLLEDKKNRKALFHLRKKVKRLRRQTRKAA